MQQIQAAICHAVVIERPACRHDFQMYPDVGRRQMACPMIRPLDQSDGARSELLGQPKIVQLSRVTEAVEIDVVHAVCGYHVRLYQRVGRTGYSPFMPQALQESARKGRFASAEIAFEVDEELWRPARLKCTRQTPSLSSGRPRIRENQ